MSTLLSNVSPRFRLNGREMTSLDVIVRDKLFSGKSLPFFLLFCTISLTSERVPFFLNNFKYMLILVLLHAKLKILLVTLEILCTHFLKVSLMKSNVRNDNKAYAVQTNMLQTFKRHKADNIKSVNRFEFRPYTFLYL